MKKAAILVISAFFCLYGMAQTNPAVQNLPVNINFGTANFMPPFSNMVAWTGDGTRPYGTQAAAEASLPGADMAAGVLFSSNPTAAPTGGQYGGAVSGNARLTIATSANTTAGTSQAALAINTSGATSTTISYDLGLSVPNPRVVGLVLQYRVGNSGPFTTIAGSAVSYTSGSTNGGDADGSTDYDNYSFALPAAALGQPEVQIRWATWRSGAGNSSAVFIDNISIGGAIPNCTEPIAQPTSLNLSATPNSVTGNFTAAVPAVDDYLIVVSTSSSLSQVPADGTTYTAGQALGNGTIVQFDAITSFTNNGLAQSTTYYYFIFADSSLNCGNGPNYLITAPLTGSITTPAVPVCVAPAIAPTLLNLAPSGGSVSGSFTAEPTADRYLVVRSSSSTLSASPADGVMYTPGQSFGGGTVVSYGTAVNFVAGGLSPVTLYYFFVFSASGDCTGEPFYNTTSLNGSVTTTNGFNDAAYYSTATGTCQTLKTNLKNIISAGTQVFTYTPGLWNAYYYTDLHRNDANNATIVWDMYSDNPSGAEPYTFTYGANQCGNYSGEGDCYNREHSMPQSYFSSASPMVSDLHHIFPTDGKVNGQRADFPYGEVTSPNWTSQNGSKRGNGNNFGYTGVVFEPINAYKGDFARAQLYMAVRYEDVINTWYSNGTANDVLLSPAEQPNAAIRKLQVFDDWYIQLLFKWHYQDPVSQKEIDRNNAIYDTLVTDGASTKKQGNRNPFIDHPEYAYFVWQCVTVIPVTLIDFKATKNGKDIILQWYATRESNFKQYVIERSTDGINYYAIGTVPGQNLANYNFTDTHLPDAVNVYYRLKMVDIDAKFSYSKIVSVRIDKFSGMIVYPNPAHDQLSIKLQHSITSGSMIIISDIAGRIVVQQSIGAATTSIDLNIGKLAAGRYFVKVAGSNNVLNAGFIKQ